jgi:8-oxo-dGTP diphosphatase
VSVAVGVVLDDRDRILISHRHPDSHQGGLWEFPGGKLEPGEGVRQALVRELLEELAIVVLAAKPLLQIDYDYPDKQVALKVWLVTDFEGDAEGREGQPLRWVAREHLHDYAFPAANLPIIEALEALT